MSSSRYMEISSSDIRNICLDLAVRTLGFARSIRFAMQYFVCTAIVRNCVFFVLVPVAFGGFARCIVLYNQ
jgi:hypothetical protein